MSTIRPLRCEGYPGLRPLPYRPDMGDWDLSSDSVNDYSGILGMTPNDGRDDTPWPYTLTKWARVPIMDMISVRIGGRAE